VDGRYSVSSAYLVLHNKTSGENNKHFNEFWNVKTLPNAQFLAWRVMLDKLPTRLSLVRKGVDLSCTLCPLC